MPETRPTPEGEPREPLERPADAQGVDASPASGQGGEHGVRAHAPHASQTSGGSPIPEPPSERELVLLRSLLMSREIALLEEIKARLDSPIEHARDVSKVVVEAMALRAGKDDTLNTVLGPAFDANFKDYMRKRPQDVAGSLFPIIGSTIRRSISETFRSMMEGFSKSLELSFSLRGLRWRLEAMRTGRPFSEIVLLHTLLYRVEQVFFIHADTGLKLAHTVNEGVETQDGDMVSAMLTAIQDFVRDCFASGREGQLESLRLGDFTIVVERAPQAYLACVVRGTPPSGFRERMATTLDLMLVECADAFESFTGDDAPFQVVLPRLQDLLISKAVQERGPLSFWAKLIPVLVLLALIGGFGWLKYRGWQEQKEAASHHQYMERGVDAFRNEPGYALLDVKKDPGLGVWEVFCLQDGLARPAATVLREAGVLPQDYVLNLTPYLSYQPELVVRRLMDKLNPPPTVKVQLRGDGVLSMEGTAPMGWILQARQTALSQPGVGAVDTGNLKDPRNERLMEMVNAVEGAVVLFPMGSATPDATEMKKLSASVDTLVALERLAGEMGMAVGLTIYGHADATGNDKRNYEISQERAKTLAAMLYSRGSFIPVSLYGLGSDYADRSKAMGDLADRKIELHVRLSLAPEADFEILQGQYQ